MLKPINDTLFNKLQAVYTKRPRFFSIDNWRKKVLLLLDEPEFSTNPKWIKYLLELVLGKEQKIAEKAVKCIKASVAEMQSLDWIALSEDIKGSGYYTSFSRTNWLDLTSHDVDKLREFKDDAMLLMGLVSFHPNGYIREDALHLLNKFNDGKEILFLLLRLNDWVGPVRKAAEAYFIMRLDQCNTREFLRYLPIVYHLENCDRQDHKQTIQRVEALLEKGENKRLFLQALKSDDRYVRRVSYKILSNLDSTDPDIILAGLNNTDSIVQRRAIKNVFANINVDNGCFYYDLFRNNKFSNVRKYAPELLSYCTNLDWIEELKALLLDESSQVRDIARFYLRKKGFTDFKTLYISNLEAANPHLYAAICGLGEVGNNKDAELVLEFIKLPQIRIKKAVLRVLDKLDAPGYYADFMKYLDSDLVGVSKEARRGLEGCTHLVEEAKLWAILEKDNIPAHVFENVVTLFNKLPKWKSLIQLLRLFKLYKPGLDKRINLELQNWIAAFNRSFVSPSIDEHNVIEQLFNLNKDKLSLENERELKVLLRTEER